MKENMPMVLDGSTAFVPFAVFDVEEDADLVFQCGQRQTVDDQNRAQILER